MKEACLRLSSRQKARSQLTTILISKAFHRPLLRSKVGSRHARHEFLRWLRSRLVSRL